MFETARGFLESYSRFPAALGQRLNVLIVLLVVALMTTSCGMPAQAAGTQNQPDSLNVSGSLPPAAVNQPYGAALAVNGGSSPYHFSVKTGVLPPGISLNPSTGTLSGKPTTAGAFGFVVIVTDSPLLAQGSQSFIVNVANNNNGGGGGGGGGSVQVSVSPTSATLFSKGKQQFTATVSGTSDTAVTWSATAGSVDTNGLYTAPTVSSQTSATVTATSSADSTKSASAAVTINPVAQTLQITTGSLPQGQQGDVYSGDFSATGGTSPYSWSVSGGTVPPGTSMNANGDFGGTPTATGTFNFTVTVTDATDKTATGNFSVVVVSSSGYDGPAQLPIATVPSAMADSPAPGTVINVNAGGNLQTALNNAQCGDIIQLQAGATFTGKFSVPAKNCDINHWIWIRTSSPDSALPAEGQRTTPCYAGVASLEGRPQYPCSNPTNVLAKVQMQTNGAGPFQLANGANFYRFIGLEVTRPAGAPGGGILISGQGTSDHIIVDHSWLHGAPQDETHDGVNLNGMTNGAVIDSYFSDFHCVVKGLCTDAHAVAGGVSNTQDGPFLIQDNFLEASGEAILFGGGPATLTPTDIQILNNHFWKPWQWMQGNTPFVGGLNGNPFIVKNHLELKNAVRVQIEGNLMENCWGGFSQTGHAIVLTPKNQHEPNGQNVCPLCQVTDVTVRYSQLSHLGGGIQMATALGDSGRDGGAQALAGTRWSIHDVVIDDLSTKYIGGGEALEIGNTWPKNALNTITINHITAFPDSSRHMLVTGNAVNNASMYGLVFTNNMITTGQYPVWNTEDTNSCAAQDVPITSITHCFTTNTFANNALIATPSAFPPSKWPANNLFPQTVDVVGFINYNNGNGGNYELQANSPYKNMGTDGKDLGADIVGLNEALANVE
jgi:Putative Ig domain